MEYRKNEKGVALLLALGFAALLLVLIMGFATNALIERKVAANNGDKTQARGLAMSALNRAIVAMQYQMQEQIKSSYDQGLHRFDNIVSKYDSTAATNFSDSDFESLFDDISGRYLLKYRDYFYIYEYPKEDDVDYNYNDNGETISDNKMRRPQWQYVSDENSTDSPLIIGRFWYAVVPDVGRVHKSANGKEKNNRYGYSVKEFDVSQMGVTDADSDFEHIAKWFSELNDPDSSLRSRAFAVFNRIEPLVPDSGISNEYYRSSDGKFEKKMVNILTENLKASELVTKVDYLNGKEQLAANIVGMFDSDIALDDISDKANWDSDVPTYTGNMLTPYLNEIEVKLTGLEESTVTKGDTNSDGKEEFEIIPKVNVVISFEFYDPFERGYDVNSEIVFKNFTGVVEFLKGSDTGSEKNIDLSEASWDKSGATGKYPVVTVTVPVEGSAIKDESGFKVSARLKNFEGDWIYKRDGKFVDYVKDLKKADSQVDGTTGEMTIESTSPTAPVGGTVFSAQAKDALNNLDAVNGWTTDKPSTIGDKNSGVTENTVFNNLSEYVKGVSGATPTLADLRFVSIADGYYGDTLNILNSDAKELLDQLTTMKDTNPQLIDINTRSVAVWKGLLNGIKKEDGLTDILSDADTIAKAISNNIRGDKFFKKRSDFVEFFHGLSEVASIDSPLLIGKMISLCKTEDYPQYVNLIVVAQTVKDNQGLRTVGTYDEDIDTITSEVRYLVKLHRDDNYKMQIISIEELID